MNSLAGASLAVAASLVGIGLLVGARWLLVTGVVLFLFSQIGGAAERYRDRG